MWGLIKKQLDLQLLDALARRHPTWSFVFVGPRRHEDKVGTLIQRLADLPNVHFLGEKPVSELPSYTQHIDVCTLCYKVDDYTKFIYPLKLHESLASGQPGVGAPSALCATSPRSSIWPIRWRNGPRPSPPCSVRGSFGSPYRRTACGCPRTRLGSARLSRRGRAR